MNYWRKINRLVIWGGILLAVLPVAVLAQTKITFIPQWMPQAQFAGYYVALNQGYFQARGLDVNILDGGPERAPSQLLASGQADIGSFYMATVLKKREEGLKLVHVSQLVQRSSLMLVSKKSSGIKSIQDIDGKRVSIWGEEFQLQPQALARKYRLMPQFVPQGVTINMFLKGGVDVASAAWYNEYHLLLNAGLDPDEINTFFYYDYGLNFPEEGIYCTESYWQAHREAVCKFAAAVKEGWQWAFAHKEKALEMVMHHSRQSPNGVNYAHQMWMLKRMEDLIVPNKDWSEYGRLQQKDYENVGAEMLKAGAISSYPPYNQMVGDCRLD